MKRSERPLLSESKGESRFLGGFGKVLRVNGNVSNAEFVVGNETLHRSGTVMDGELCAVRLVGRGSARIILGVKEASNGSALCAGNPEVARS